MERRTASLQDRLTIVRRLTTCLTLAVFLATAQDVATFSTDVKVVNILATALGKKGEIIRDLVKDDFSILENGRPQTIRYFVTQTDLPLTVGLMVDTSMSQHRVLESERSASFRFFDQVVREEKDRVFIMQFDLAIQLNQPLTSSRRKLEEALSLVDTPTRNELRMQSGGAGTLLYDAVLKASNDTMKDLPGRKALILLTDGVDNGSETTLAKAVEAAQRSDTLIYSILFSDEGFYSGAFAPDGRAALSRMSRESGGGYFEVSKKHSIEQIFGVIQDELRSQYSLGYVSDEPVRISEFRKLQIGTRRKGVVLQARNRYWAKR